MSEKVMNCSVHGERAIEEVVKFKSSRSPKGFKYKCKICKKAENLKYKSSRRKELAEKTREYKKENREIVNAWNRMDRKRNPEKYKQEKLRHEQKYGKAYGVTTDILSYFKITKEDYDLLFLEQNNLCAICNKTETKKSRTPGNICRLAVDHCHFCWGNGNKGMISVRGLLCHSCNTAIGKFRDNPELLRKAALYLEVHNHVE